MFLLVQKICGFVCLSPHPWSWYFAIAPPFTINTYLVRTLHTPFIDAPYRRGGAQMSKNILGVQVRKLVPIRDHGGQKGMDHVRENKD